MTTRGWFDTPLRRANTIVVVLALAVAVVFPLFADAALTGVGFVALIYAIRNFTWNIAGGFVGLLSLAHASAFGVGAFAVAVLAWGHGWNPWLAMLVGALAAAVLGLVTSLVMSRFGVNAFFYALGTMAITLALQGVAASWDLLGAATGLQNLGAEQGFAALQWFLDPTPFYFIALTFLVLVTVGTALMMRRTRFGRSLPFIREDPVMAASMGVPVVRNQALAMAISMGLTAVPGTLMAQYVQFVSYDSVLTLEIGVAMLVGTIIGGAGTLAGPIVAGIGIAAVEELLRGLEVSSANVSSYTQIVYAVLVIAVLRFGAHGIVPMWESAIQRLSAPRRRPPSGDDPPLVSNPPPVSLSTGGG
ncbi:branched-chain amino acid ABC transporter permease [Pseudonocardia humida]|uniref:Branched-chain amino acid ABC transporter permease n=1 Tax=Pseudonocardia humida TaxID=2800819 RepID=A0ABT1A2C9_9PSEU|nr:branched-chain amino acid ABC transporter permease [Pseudonocardia humida]MCO1657080.1 branched-chain amino acid ABC transporter permease [Pseudonocardia humida]